MSTQPRFRMIDTDTLRAIEKTCERLDRCRPSNNATVATMTQGNFTIVMLRDGGQIGIGVAKRSTRDKYNPEAGYYLALHRAAVMLYEPKPARVMRAISESSYDNGGFVGFL